ncbi:hypothetical protein OIU79_028624 [Salix purpurea]|uniref:MULE transposase domain-containing protein n=1 Tax=Salix purpurea TaxID=77065 RepID=A0A9Q1A348_SALPP|nr:hypothetical protein OIU79_028624 [Salix purpurea]
MDRHQPKTIFTDKNELMIDAVKAVLPGAEHRIGIWYIRRNALNHLPALYIQPGFESFFNKCPEIGLFSPSHQMDSGIPAKDDGGRGIGDSEVDTAKTSDYEENRLIRRKLGLSKKQSHSYTSRVLQNT